jgi:hypothetical protein
MRVNKKGMETQTIIGLAIGILIFVLIVWWISGGFGKARAQVDPLIGDSNVNTLTNTCNIDCKGDTYKFCNEVETIKYGKKVVFGGVEVTSKDATCAQMAANKSLMVPVDACSTSCPTA